MARKAKRGTTELPADKDAEGSLLSAMISAPRQIGRIMGRVTEDTFYYPAHRTIYSALLTLYTRPSMDGQNQIDASAIRDELARMGKYSDKETDAEDVQVSWSYLQRIVESAPSITDITYYADRVLERSRDRALLLVSAEMEKIAQEPGPSREKHQKLRRVSSASVTAWFSMPKRCTANRRDAWTPAFWLSTTTSEASIRETWSWSAPVLRWARHRWFCTWR
jgi:replicative DNA helicase